MRLSLRAAALSLVLLGCLLPGSSAADNSCSNTIEGTPTSAQIVNTVTVIGCGNTVRNNLAADGPMVIEIAGDNNLIQNNVQTTNAAVNPFSFVGSGNNFTGNVAESFYLNASKFSPRENNMGVYNSVIKDNTAGSMEFGSDTSVDLESNDAFVSLMSYGSVNTTAKNNKDVKSRISINNDENDVIESNEAVESDLSFSSDVNITAKQNYAGASMYVSDDTSAVIESNQADVYFGAYNEVNVTVVRNSFTNWELSHNTNSLIVDNFVTSDGSITNSNNLTATNNAVYKMTLDNADDMIFSNLQQALVSTKPSSLINIGLVDTTPTANPDLLGSARQILYGSSLRFVNERAIRSEISGISDNYTSVDAWLLSKTAASSAQAAALAAALAAATTAQTDALAVATTAQAAALAVATTAQAAALAAATTTQSTALATAITNATAAGATADAALQKLISDLTAEVATLKTGFCPPAASGRHLLADLTPIVPPAGCPGAGGSGTPPPDTNPVEDVVTTLEVTGINLATFSTTSVAAALAATAGVNAADVAVVVTDYPVTTTVSFNGVALTSLTTAQVAALETAIDAKLPAVALTPALGTVTPAGRRLLDLSFPVTVTLVGDDPVLAAQTQAAVTSAATLGAAATAAGISASAVTATPATVSVVMTITVRAASAAAATNIATALAPGNVAAITTALAAAGVSNTGVTISAPVVGEAPKSAASSGSKDSKDLFALLVLLIIPIGGIGYVAGQYLERQRATKTQDFSKAHAVDSITVVETA